MLDWWFEWVGYAPLRYKIWNPGLYAQALYEKPHSVGVYSISKAISESKGGATKHTVEAIGFDTKLQNLYITFVDPASFGIDTTKLGTNQHTS
jgi:hypothetical protein